MARVHSLSRAKLRSTIIYHILVCGVGIIMIYPLIWMILSSFKPNNTIFQTSSTFLVENPTFENYVNGWKGFSKTSFDVFILNSFIIALFSTVLSCISCTVVGYGLGRLRFKGRSFIFAVVLLTMMLPEQVMMIPQYLWFNKLGWINSYKPLIIPKAFAIQGFFVFLIVNYMHGIPKELDESAKIDGCSYMGIFSKIIVPLSKPAIGTIAIFAFINSWNEYMSPLLYIKTTRKYPVSLALKLFCDNTGTSDYGAMFAMSVVSLVPIVLIFIFLQKNIVEGVSTQGLKG